MLHGFVRFVQRIKHERGQILLPFASRPNVREDGAMDAGASMVESPLQDEGHDINVILLNVLGSIVRLCEVHHPDEAHGLERSCSIFLLAPDAWDLLDQHLCGVVLVQQTGT